MWSREYWIAVAERALKSFAGALLTFGGSDIFNLLTVPWVPALGLAGGAALSSVLFSIMSAQVGEKGTPSLVSSRGRHARPGE